MTGVALVTGAARGIGAAVAERLSRDGYAVLVADLSGEAANETAERLSAAGGRAEAATIDVTDPHDVARMVHDCVAHFGGLHVAVNNAGIGTPHAPTADVELDAWRATIDVNLHGVFHCMRAELRAMREAGGGSVINIGSVMSVRGARDAAAYAASKHAVLGLTRSAALDHAADGIRVNCVGPGFVRTDLLDAATDGERRSALAARHPRGMLAAPEDVAGVVAFLASADASNVTGAFYAVDGGYTV